MRKPVQAVTLTQGALLALEWLKCPSIPNALVNGPSVVTFLRFLLGNHQSVT